MTDTPERIWAWAWPDRPRLGQWTSIEEQAGECREYIRRDAVFDLPEVKALVEAAEQLLPRNLGQARWMSDEAIIPVDMTMGEIRKARAAIDAIKAKP